MSSEEKARQLIDMFRDKALAPHVSQALEDKVAKQCALIAVDEILEIMETLAKPEYVARVAKNKFHLDETEYDTHLHGYEMIDYFKAVKSAIEKL